MLSLRSELRDILTSRRKRSPVRPPFCGSQTQPGAIQTDRQENIRTYAGQSGVLFAFHLPETVAPSIVEFRKFRRDPRLEKVKMNFALVKSFYILAEFYKSLSRKN